MWYSILADVIVALHLGYVSYVLIGQILILLGWIMGWGWVRNLWFRVTHLAAILVVAIESIFEIECPMTTWEYDLRILAEQDAAQGSFIGRFLGDILFYDAQLDAYRTDRFSGWQNQPTSNGVPLFGYGSLGYTLLTPASAASPSPSDGPAPSASAGESGAPATPAPSGDGGTGGDSASSMTPLLLGAAAIVVVVGAGLVLMRRRSSAAEDE